MFGISGNMEMASHTKSTEVNITQGTTSFIMTPYSVS